MRTDNWPMDRIMRLPDWCFGRHYWVGLYAGSTGGTIFYGMCQEQLPDKFVVWGTFLSCRSPSAVGAMRGTLRLGNYVPVNIEQVRAMERIYKSISDPDIVYEWYFDPNAVTWVNPERMLIESAGRTLVTAINGDQTNAFECTVGVLISSMPREVPDWLLSGQGKNL